MFLHFKAGLKVTLLGCVFPVPPARLGQVTPTLTLGGYTSMFVATKVFVGLPSLQVADFSRQRR